MSFTWTSPKHRHLLLKLQSYGINDKYLSWISNFLLGCSQRVTVAGTGSDWAPVLSGVPQGHVGHIVAKGGQLLGLLINNRDHLCRDMDVMKTLYTALVRPHLDWSTQMLCGIPDRKW